MSKKINIVPELTIPFYLVGDVRSKLAYVDENILSAFITSEGKNITLDLREELNEQKISELEKKVQHVVVLMVKGAIKPKVSILEDHLNIPVPFSDDPNIALQAQGEMFQETSGVFTLGPLISRLIEFFESYFIDLADSFEAIPYRFPSLTSAEFLQRVKYFHTFPHSLSFVTHLREDLDIIEAFAKEASCEEHGLNTPPESFAKIQALLSPAVCYHLYFSLADKTIPNGQLAVTGVGQCFRYEAINLVSLERMWNFSMREIIFVGSKNFVLTSREKAQQKMRQILEDIGLAYRVESANDPFFIGEFKQQIAYQSAFQLKYEIRARLPFKNSTLAVGSYNYHQDFFGRHLNINLPDGSPAHTTCIAFGLERLAYAFLSQYGLDKQLWPKVVQKSLNKKNDL